MKNANHNASVADYFRKINRGRDLALGYRELLDVMNASICSESWPPQGRRHIDDPTTFYEFTWRLTLSSAGNLDAVLSVIDQAQRNSVSLNDLPMGALKRFVELREALDDYLRRGGDWPTPAHMPGGSRLEPGR